MTEQPLASAGASFHVAISSGKFQGSITLVHQLAIPLEDGRDLLRDFSQAVADRLAAFQAFHDGQPDAVAPDQRRQLQQRFLALFRRAARPDATAERPPRRRDRTVHVLLSTVGQRAQHGARGRVGGLEQRAVVGCRPVAVKEGAVRQAQAGGDALQFCMAGRGQGGIGHHCSGYQMAA